MNCRELVHLVESRRFGVLTEAQRRDGEAHAGSCRHCAPVWVAYARVAAMRVPPMPPELAAHCRALVATQAQRSVLRFARRGMVITVGGFVVLAAAAGALTVHLAGAPESRQGVAVSTAPPVPMPSQTSRYIPPTEQVEKGDSDMNRSLSVAAAAVVLSAAAAVEAQTAPTDESRQRTPEEIIAANDLNKDGLVTREEAATVNRNLHVMWSVYDLNGDGRMDVVELTRAIAEVQVGTALDRVTGNSGGNMAAARPETILANNDLNKDGVITKAEAQSAGRALIRMWDSYDLNADGVVDMAELAKAQGY